MPSKPSTTHCNRDTTPNPHLVLTTANFFELIAQHGSKDLFTKRVRQHRTREGKVAEITHFLRISREIQQAVVSVRKTVLQINSRLDHNTEDSTSVKPDEKDVADDAGNIAVDWVVDFILKSLFRDHPSRFTGMLGGEQVEENQEQEEGLALDSVTGEPCDQGGCKRPCSPSPSTGEKRQRK